MEEGVSIKLLNTSRKSARQWRFELQELALAFSAAEC
jgi:hypothetical protein